MATATRVDRWIDALIQRHTTELTRAELLKSVRALSARYVERRAELSNRSPLDSAGKRAAFAAFYAPLHLLTVSEIARTLGPRALTAGTVTDLGCGTGVACAGWALATGAGTRLIGVDRNEWLLREAAWNWRTLGLHGRTKRGDMVDAAAELAATRGGSTAVVLGWSVNELAQPARERLLQIVGTLAARGTALLVVEPIARQVTPWWTGWREALQPFGAVSSDWKFDIPLPPLLRDFDRDAGFARQTLTARTLWIPAAPSG
ncbi:MAG: class I SAM-dependent methyltransferase [Vicinamibacterales bacterium]